MNRPIYGSLLTVSTCFMLMFLTHCSSSSTPVVSIAATSGSGQTTVIDTTFAKPLVATVTTGGNATAGVAVTFTASATGAGGTFAEGSYTETETTDANGVATSTKFTANTTSGAYTVTASVSGASTSFSLSNTAATLYSFCMSGLEVINNTTGSPNYYALAGSVVVDANGNVVAGEQDYNDGNGLTSPSAGDSVTGGALAVDATGQGTLTIVTDNTALGVAGTETLGIQFVNTNHAVILQFDGSATSSGSIDVQTLPSAVSGGYAITVSGVDPAYNGLAFGGVFSVTNGTLTGTIDSNDDGTVMLASAFNGTMTAADRFGRGQLTGINVSGIALTLNYYIVGPEAFRIIDVDGTDSAMGSAFGQGSNSSTASNASLGNSIFGIEPNSWGYPLYAAAGMLIPDSGSGTFTGVGDDDEEGSIVAASPISGTYTIAANGYGTLLITNEGLLDVTSLGIYATDPTLNLLDPNNTTGGGGALVLDLSPNLSGGTGLIIPQKDSAADSFTGNYSFDVRDYNGTSASGWEFDSAGQGSVASGVLTGSGLVNDGFGFFSATSELYTAVPFLGAAAPDVVNPGRYTISPLDITAVTGSPVPFSIALYQASGGSLFWMDEDAAGLSLGSLQQKSSLAGLHAKRKRMASTRVYNRRDPS
jgi:hypothetical protein